MDELNYWKMSTRRWTRRRVFGAASAAGLAAGTLGLAACSSRPAAPAAPGTTTAPAAQATPQNGGTLNYSMAGNSPLDPQKVSAGAQSSISGVMSRLFQFKTGPKPDDFSAHDLDTDLGLSAESPDATTWTIKLRNDARFTTIPPVNGHAVEAEDVRASFVRALDPATSNPNRGSLNMIDANQIQTPDKQTVVFKLAFPYAPFQATLGSPAYSWIFPREVLSGGYDPTKTVIGSGPFTLDRVQPDVAYTYKKNPDYYNKSLPHVDAINLAVVPDPSQQLAQFTAGKIDLLGVDPSNADTIKQQNPKATLLRVPDGRAFPIYLQMGDPAGPMLDIRVRQALSLAIDRQALAKAIYNGQGQYTLFVPAYMGKWAITVDDLDAATKQWYQYNPQQAKQLLAAAGQSNLQLQFIYVQPGPFSTPAYIQQAQTVASMLNSAGIKTTLVTHDYNKDFVDSGHGSRQGYYDKNAVGFFAEAVYNESDEYLYSYFHSKSTSNQEHLSDPQLDAMIDKERTLVDQSQRLKAVQDIQKYIAQKVYCVPTVGSYGFQLVNPRLQNYQYTQSLGVQTESYAKLWVSG